MRSEYQTSGYEDKVDSSINTRQIQDILLSRCKRFTYPSKRVPGLGPGIHSFQDPVGVVNNAVPGFPG